MSSSSSSMILYENSEPYDHQRPITQPHMRICSVDNCVVDKCYTEISQKEIDAYDLLHKNDPHYEYCSVSTTDGNTMIICDAAILKTSPVLACMIDAHQIHDEHHHHQNSEEPSSPLSIQFPGELIQAITLPIVTEKMVFQHTWQNSIYGTVPRDPVHYNQLCERDELIELAVFVALDTLEL